MRRAIVVLIAATVVSRIPLALHLSMSVHLYRHQESRKWLIEAGRGDKRGGVGAPTGWSSSASVEDRRLE